MVQFREIKKVLKSSELINRKWAKEMHIASVHHGISGHYREAMWMELFRGIVPRKYALAQGVILIDSYGSCSKEVDLAIYDEQYIPYVFRHNSICYIPIEAVAAAIQCKSTQLNVGKLKKWVASIRGLKTDRNQGLKTNRSGIARFESKYFSGYDNYIQTGTRPLIILACNRIYRSDKSMNTKLSSLEDLFDIILYQKSGEALSIQAHIRNMNWILGEWGTSLNCKDPDEIESEEKESQTSKERKKVIQIGKEDVERYLSSCADKKQSREELRSILLKHDDLEQGEIKLTLSDLELNRREHSWLSLNLQINQLLMLRNNPMLFPHYAYARKFREIAGGSHMENNTPESKNQIRAYANILHNYSYLNKKLAIETRNALCHSRDAARDLWLSFLRNIIPMKFSIDKNVIIMDSKGKQSEELDLVVYDEQYIPYVFQYHSVKYVPIEAVSVVVKLHHQDGGQSRATEDWDHWFDSINLNPCPYGIARFATNYKTGIANPTQLATRPIRVFISTANIEGRQPLEDKISGIFDFLLYLKPGADGTERFELNVPKELDHLEQWAEKLNGVNVKDKWSPKINKDGPLTLSGLQIDGNPLLTLNFQLNQLLMLINNPMLFPHYAYAKLFQDIEREESE